MYKFGPGIVLLCDKMNLREELLNYYIEKEEFDKIIKLCSDHGEREINLWVQALKFFSKPSTEGSKSKKRYITEALAYIQKIESFQASLDFKIRGIFCQLISQIPSYVSTRCLFRKLQSKFS